MIIYAVRNASGHGYRIHCQSCGGHSDWLENVADLEDERHAHRANVHQLPHDVDRAARAEARAVIRYAQRGLFGRDRRRVIAEAVDTIRRASRRIENREAVAA